MRYVRCLLLIGTQCTLLFGGEKLEFFRRSLQHEDESMALHMLLYDGLCVHTCTAYGETLLMSAAWSNRKRVVRALMQAGVDVNAQTNYGGTALMGAAKNGHEDVVRLLIAAGADLNAQDQAGRSALIWAVRRNHARVITLLIGAGAHVNVSPKREYAPAAHALLAGNHDVLVYLLKSGADLIIPEELSCDDVIAYVQYLTGRAACVVRVLEQEHDVPRDLTRLIWHMADCPASVTPPPPYEQS